MLVNADFSLPALVAGEDLQWVPSPQAGVERVMLDRLGGERARATSLVRYAAGSSFPAHSHPGGEEILVLEGTFSEDGRHFPAGYYLRNPPGSSHRPSSEDGALLFVKLWQMSPDETAPVRIDTRDPAVWTQGEGGEICALFHGAHERVTLQRLSPGHAVFYPGTGGIEALVIEGQLMTAERSLGQGSWLRLPPGAPAPLVAGSEGAMVYLKTGHLP